MATSTLQKITARAKQIRKKHPGKAWNTCIKEAGREYREGGIGKVRRKGGAKKKKTTVRVKVSGTKRSRPVKRVGAVGAVTVAQHLSAAKKGLMEQLAWGLATREQAKTKTAKRKISKRLVEVRRKLRAL